VYNVFRQLGNGEFVHVASRDELEQARQLVEGLNAHWPGGYVVRDSRGNYLSLTELPEISPERLPDGVPVDAEQKLLEGSAVLGGGAISGNANRRGSNWRVTERVGPATITSGKRPRRASPNTAGDIPPRDRTALLE
jgi:hypothetical protein